MAFSLRPYQKKALTVISNDLKTQKNVLLHGIVGCGKTLMFCRLIERYYNISNKQFLLLMHKQELIQQTYKTFIEQTNIPASNISICCAALNRKEINKRVTIGSIQTFINHVDFYYGCDLLIIDEAHLIQIGTGSQYDQVIDMLRAKTPNMRIFGCTSTPHRLNSGYIYGDRCKPGTINLFSKINHKITYAELRDSKPNYLMPLIGQVAFENQLITDLEGVDKNGDYALEQLGMVMTKPIHIGTAVQAIKEYTEEYKHICVFACTIDHAERLKDAINEVFPDQATTVHSKLTAIERAANMAAWKNGRKRIITSVNILVEGFDFPPLDCLIMVRPTESTGLFLQAIGRVLRTSEGKKKALLVDLTTNTKKFGTDLDNMKVIIPKTASEQGKKKNEKYCPECDEKVHIIVRICPKCGFEWTVEENEKIIAKQMPELKKILFQKKEPEKLFPDIPPTWHDVYDIKASIHISKQNKNKLGKISLFYDAGAQDIYSGYGDPFVNVWLCMPDFYEGYAVEKAKSTWAQFTDAPFPENIDEFMVASDCGDIAKPTKILLDHNEKWPKIKEINFDHFDDSDIPF